MVVLGFTSMARVLWLGDAINTMVMAMVWLKEKFVTIVLVQHETNEEQDCRKIHIC